MTESEFTLSSFTVTPDEVQLFQFSAATGNPHRIHYDAPFAIAVERHRGVVVPGPLMGSWMLLLVERSLAAGDTIRSLTYRNLRSAFAGETLSVHGRTETDDPSTIRLEVRNASDECICQGDAAIERMAALRSG